MASVIRKCKTMCLTSGRHQETSVSETDLENGVEVLNINYK